VPLVYHKKAGGEKESGNQEELYLKLLHWM
jgi:hypothetical protein